MQQVVTLMSVIEGSYKNIVDIADIVDIFGIIDGIAV